MALFDSKQTQKREDELLQDKRSRAVAIVLSSQETRTMTGYSGKAVFQAKRSDGWKKFSVDLKEDFGALIPGDQWIVKFDEEFSRIITLHVKLAQDSPHRITPEE